MQGYTSPFRLQVLEALKSYLHTITPPNYQTNLAADDKVVRGRLYLGDDEPNVMVSILEPAAVIETMRQQEDSKSSAGNWDLLIQGWAQDPINDATAQPCDHAYVLADDVRRALVKAKTVNHVRGSNLGHNILGFGTKITDWKVGAAVVRPTEEVSGYGVFYMILSMKIVEDLT